MRLTFGDDAHDAFTRTVATIPAGYTVALLKDGESVPTTSDLVPYPTGPDVQIVGTTPDGVTFHRINVDGDVVEPAEVELRPWVYIAEVHVY